MSSPYVQRRLAEIRAEHAAAPSVPMPAQRARLVPKFWRPPAPDLWRLDQQFGIEREQARLRVLPLDQLRGLRMASRLGARRAAARVSGLYFLWRGPRLVYVGRSVNIGYRMEDHATNKAFTHATWMRVRQANQVDLERAMIRHYRPELNERDW